MFIVYDSIVIIIANRQQVKSKFNSSFISMIMYLVDVFVQKIAISLRKPLEKVKR